MGCCWFGSQAPTAGRCHWQQMLDNVRKPVAQWHRLCDFATVDRQLRQASIDDPPLTPTHLSITTATSLPPHPPARMALLFESDDVTTGSDTERTH